MYTVTWMDRKGAGLMKTFHDLPKLVKFLRNLKATATVRDDAGTDIGGVHRALPGECDDLRVKWLWSVLSLEGTVK